MTSDTITIRLRRTKAEIRSRARPNINSWVNDLIDQALGPNDPDWAELIERKKSQRPVRFRADKMRVMER